jgi:hypothetical protein
MSIIHKIIFYALILGLSFRVSAQLQNNIEIEVVGKPSWQLLIPMGTNGLLFFIKTDQTKAKVFKFDKDLAKTWEKDLFLDVERAPTAYTFDPETATFLFRETSGMYYQLFSFNLKTGEFDAKGFELREYFQDQDYVFLKDRLLMAGANEKGAAFYEYKFEEEKGQMLDAGIPGKVQVQEFQMSPDGNSIAALWAVKVPGYSNEKKKKGEYIKDAFISAASYDLSGKLLGQTELKQERGAFAVSARSIILNGERYISGLYQNNSGDKGLYLKNLVQNSTMKTYSFVDLLKNTDKGLNPKEISDLLSSYQFLMNEPIKGNDGILIGGVFYMPQYRTVTEQVYDPNAGMYDPYGRRNNGLGRSNTRSQSKTVFAGIHYPLGLVLGLDENAEILRKNRIDINILGSEVKPTLSYNAAGSVAYCIKGNLAAQNYNIGSKPIVYKLSNDNSENNLKTAQFIPQYSEVRYWYENYFIADGQKNKMEVVQLENAEELNKETKTSRKKKRQGIPAYTQTRKIIYLTKIASGD